MSPLRLVLALSLALPIALPGAALARKCPNAMFVIDRSGSMALDPKGGTGQSKWNLARNALLGACDKYGKRLPFGLEMFTSKGGRLQCYTDTRIDVAVDHKTCPAMQAIIFGPNGTPDLNGTTNAGEAIKRAYLEGHLNDPTRSNFIILISDGSPNCTAEDQGNAQYTISEIKNAANLTPPVHTIIVGFDVGLLDQEKMNLNAMAQAGLEPQAGCNPTLKLPCYYNASTSDAFNQAMDKIVEGLTNTSVAGGCDDTCFGQGCPDDGSGNPEICVYPKPGEDPICVQDHCAGLADCPGGQYCRDGSCIPVCPYCGDGRYCVNGMCQDNKCGAISLQATQYCDPEVLGVQTVNANCLMSKPLFCPLPTYCDAATGACRDDPCHYINCPPRSTCNATGWCMTDAPDIPDMAVARSDGGNGDDESINTGRGGCAVGGGPTPVRSALPLALLLGAFFGRRRKHQRSA